MRSIGKYQIIGLLGRGGMGSVYKVRLPVVGKVVALKILRPDEHLVDLLGEDEVRRQFVNEAQVMAGITHPNVAGVWDYGEHRGQPFFVLEYVCGNLGSLIGESYRVETPTRRLPMDMALDYARQTLSGLARLHYAGIVHRDMKPFNLLLTNDGTVKIIDFGLSRLRGEEGPGTPDTLKVGSPYYTAPEQESDPDAAGPRSDLFSVAVMLYRLLTGRLPFDDEQQRTAAQAAALACQVNPDLDDPWEDFFCRALAGDPAERSHSALAMRDALAGLEDHWRRRVEQICRLEDLEAEPVPPSRRTPRHEPVHTGPVPAHDVFEVDELARPLAYAEHDFEQHEQADVVVDKATGLAWQRSGAPYPLDGDAALQYVEDLNRERLDGHADWRLPTVDELCTILRRPPELGDFCAEPVFDTAQRILWSADRRSFAASWHVHASMGYVGWQDNTCGAWVRAVRTRNP